MNDICFSKCKINSIEDNGGMKIIKTITKIKTEQNNHEDIFLDIYIKNSIFEEKKSMRNNENIFNIGNEISVTGKTVHNVTNGTVFFKLLIENKRRIDYSRKDYDVIIKLMDISIENLVTITNNQRIEVISKYYNTDDKKGEGRIVILSLTNKQFEMIKENNSYNISGSLFLRKNYDKRLLVIQPKTFAKDYCIEDDVFIKDLDKERKIR